MTGIWRALLMTGGTISVVLGVAGIILPLVPTTPFLLLAAFCYARSSDRCYNWLLSHRYLGPYITNWRRGERLTLRQAAVTLAVVWATVLVTAIFVIEATWLRLFFLTPAVGVTAVLAWKLRQASPAATRQQVS
jgi:uncharacterized protein